MMAWILVGLFTLTIGCLVAAEFVVGSARDVFSVAAMALSILFAIFAMGCMVVLARKAHRDP